MPEAIELARVIPVITGLADCGAPLSIDTSKAVVMERALAIASKGTGGFHVSYDLDVCDPTVAPGVGTPVKGGLSYREAHVVMEMIAESGKMTSLDLVEVNPALDVRNTTAEFGTELALSAFGKNIL